MKELLIAPDLRSRIVDSPIPEPAANEVLIRVVVSGSNPKDWQMPMKMGQEANHGDDIAGIVEKVGPNVTEFKTGDRVAAFHQMFKPHGSYAEYAIAWDYTTFHIPEKTSFEEASTLPLAALTAAVALYLNLGLPTPFKPATEPIPLIIYGAASATGAYAVQFAQRSNIHPVIAVAGKSMVHVETLIDRSKGDVIVDYRRDADAVVAALKAAAKGSKLNYAFDAVSEHGSYQNLVRVLEPDAALTLILPGAYDDIPDTIKRTVTMVRTVHNDDKDFGFVYSRLLTRALQEGWFRGQPQEVRPGGLAGVEQALRDLKDHKANGVKYIFRISETEGVERS